MSVQTSSQKLVDEFRARPTLRAGSLITTVFGDAIAPRGGTVWLGSLITAMAEFGINETALGLDLDSGVLDILER